MSEILDTYGNKTLKTGIGQYWNKRYEVWEGNCLRAWASTEDSIMSIWSRIKETEPPVRKRKKTSIY